MFFFCVVYFFPNGPFYKKKTKTKSNRYNPNDPIQRSTFKIFSSFPCVSSSLNGNKPCGKGIPAAVLPCVSLTAPHLHSPTPSSLNSTKTIITKVINKLIQDYKFVVFLTPALSKHQLHFQTSQTKQNKIYHFIFFHFHLTHNKP